MGKGVVNVGYHGSWDGIYIKITSANYSGVLKNIILRSNMYCF